MTATPPTSGVAVSFAETPFAGPPTDAPVDALMMRTAGNAGAVPVLLLTP